MGYDSHACKANRLYIGGIFVKNQTYRMTMLFDFMLLAQLCAPVGVNVSVVVRCYLNEVEPVSYTHLASGRSLL